jgi:hypothetical protein
MTSPRPIVVAKKTSHGKIGEAAALAQCWMNGIPAHGTGGLRSNFAGSDLIVETAHPRVKLWVQVKTGAPVRRDYVYLTQCAGDDEPHRDKFAADFVVLVNVEAKQAAAHRHDGQLRFEHLSFYVLPCDVANDLYRAALQREYARPKRDGGRRRLVNLAVDVPASQVAGFRDAWHLLRGATTD